MPPGRSGLTGLLPFQAGKNRSPLSFSGVVHIPGPSAVQLLAQGWWLPAGIILLVMSITIA